MSPIQDGFHLAKEALEPSFYPMVVGAVALVCTGWRAHIIQRRLWKPSYWWALAHLLLLPAAIVMGVVFAAPDGHYRGPAAGNFLGALMYGSMYGSLGLCTFWIYRMEGVRVFAAILMATMEIPVLLALFVSGMSVTGDWL